MPNIGDTINRTAEMEMMEYDCIDLSQEPTLLLEQDDKSISALASAKKDTREEKKTVIFLEVRGSGEFQITVIIERYGILR